MSTPQLHHRLKLPVVTLIILMTAQWLPAQVRVGVNTDDPESQLDIVGSGATYLRVNSNDPDLFSVGIELMRGNDIAVERDWKIVHRLGPLRFLWSDDNYATTGGTPISITHGGMVGFNILTPLSKLHVYDGETVSNSTDGIVMLGQSNSVNTVMDGSTIITRNAGSPTGLYIQSDGGNTYFGVGSGNNTVRVLEGKVAIGGYTAERPLNVEADDQFQVHMQNSGDDTNDWFVGASNASWAAGDNLLLFSPSNSSQAAIFRLTTATENDGNTAPVVIRSSASQVMLLDGNEIDTKFEPLYFNYNTEQNTYINPSGGYVGIGVTNPLTPLHFKTPGFGLGLEKGNGFWKISPFTNGNVLFHSDEGLVAQIDWNSAGNWVTLSDSRKKTNIRPLENAEALVQQVRIVDYEMRTGPGQAKDLGVIAQELEAILPEAVFQNEDQYAVSYDQLTVLAIRSIQEQQARLEKIAEEITGLEQVKK